jgi:hypothetical protein
LGHCNRSERGSRHFVVEGIALRGQAAHGILR